MSQLNRNEAVILGLLYACRKQVVRTKFVKMTYLLDNFSFELTGKTMTEFTYHWDRYGPNAVGNAIVATLEKLESRGIVRTTQFLTPYENYAHCYGIENIDAAELPLTSRDWVYIKGIATKYGSMTHQKVVKESKETLPMRGADQFTVLSFERNPEYRKLEESFFADAGFVQATKAGMEEWSNHPATISLEDLRAEVAESSRLH